MVEGDSADTCARKFSGSVDGGPSGGSSVRRPRSEDPQSALAEFESLCKFQAPSQL
jgi:hypothetical protein